MGSTSITGTGTGDSHKRIAYLSRDLPKDKFTKTTSNPQDLITGTPDSGGGGDGFPVTLQCDPPGGDPRGFQAVDLQCCREFDSQVASGDYSFIAAGCNNTSSGTWSHTEGFQNTASGEASHAAGYNNVAEGDYSTIGGGQDNTAEFPHTVVGGGLNNHAEAAFVTIGGGKNNDADTEGSVIAGGEDNYVGAPAIPSTHNTIGGGKGNGINVAAFSTISGGRYNDITGPYAPYSIIGATITGGYNNYVTANAATCCGGRGNSAIAGSAHAEGAFNIASGISSHAEGRNTLASGYASHAEGYNTTASGYASHAEGYSTIASGYYSHAQGDSTEASGDYAHAEGNETEASGRGSHAQGAFTEASGDYAHAEGYNSVASGNYSHAGGARSLASHLGEWARASGGNVGSNQVTINTLFIGTEDDTPTILTLDGNAAGVGNRFTIAVGKAYGFFINVVAKTSSDFAYFTRRCLISNTAGTTVITGAVQTIGTDIASAGAVLWSISVTADDVNDALQVEVTGDAALPVGWTAKLEATEVYNILAP